MADKNHHEEIRLHNRTAWDREVEERNRWTIPVSSEAVQRAKQGDWEVVLTPTKPVPRTWFPELQGTPTLCLASGGGQQAPLLAAAGALVTVLDNSPRQLEQDRFVAQRDGLILETREGDMADLSTFGEGTFRLVYFPCANCFAPDVRPVWRECFRVLQSGGLLLAGFVNPVRYIFDDERMENGSLEVRHSIPYSDVAQQHTPNDGRQFREEERPLEFGHSLEDQIGGQLDAGFVICGFYEDRHQAKESDPISKYLATFIATQARKP